MLQLVLTFFFCLSLAADKVYESEGQKFKVENIFKRDGVIWGFDFISDNEVLFTERSGQLALGQIKEQKVTVLKGTPQVRVQGQGGLLDVRVHPSFAKNKIIFFTYSEPIGDGGTTVLARAELKENELTQLKKIFTAYQPNDNDIHFGSRIEFDGSGHIFVSVGDRNKREQAQDLQFHMGKVMRLKENGSVPTDNPFVKRSGAKPEIWSYGHRNPQGLARNPLDGQLYEAEMGPRGGDEVNLIKPGANYGWPIITYGREYYGPKIGEGTAKEGMEQPLVHYVPSISPSAIGFYSGDKFPKWKGNAFLANLSGQHLRRLVIENQKVVKQESLLADLGKRFRNVRQGPDGYFYFSTDDGVLARLVPVK